MAVRMTRLSQRELEMGATELTNKKDDASREKRGRSTVEFPYSDLHTSIEIASKIKEKAGLSCETTQLAAWMGQSATSGTFRARYSAARLFGLTETIAGGKVALTELGQNVLNPSKADIAKARAFLKVQLFLKLYEKLKGNPLPPNAALERMVEEFGVAPKQKERARQTFMKSAHSAKFIDATTGAFIQPGFPSENGFDSQDASLNESEKAGGGGDGDGSPPSTLDPIIRGLLDRLPESSAEWPTEDRKLWLELLEGSFKLIYKESKRPSGNQI